jgi:parallel beta helix pectate lyase-like protein
VAAALALPATASAPAGPTACTATVSSPEGMRSAVDAAAPGAVVCLADGSYGDAAITTTKAPPGVTLRAQNPGRATLGVVTVDARNLAIAQLRLSGVVIQPGSSGVTVDHNLISGAAKGVDMPTTNATVDDTRITGNRFVGPFGEDAIRANRFHDADGDGVGLLVEGNEFTGVRENGEHSDCLQTAWVGDHLVYRRNYLHDNRCQGFFVKDQASAVDGILVEENLMIRDAAPCAAVAPGCGQPSVFQVFGPVASFTMRRNTIWTPEGGSPVTFQGEGWAGVEVDHNVIYRAWTSTDLTGIAFRANTSCKVEAAEGGAWPAAASGAPKRCTPDFADPAAGDYRTGDGRGVSWAVADQTYGPG